MLVPIQRRHNNVKALAVQPLHIVIQSAGRKTTHGHTAIFGDFADGQGQIKGHRCALCILTFAPAV